MYSVLGKILALPVAVGCAALAGFVVAHGPTVRTSAYQPPVGFTQSLSLKQESVVLFVGDSYTDGAEGVPRTGTYASLTCNAIGWVCNIDAVGGTGFLAGKDAGDNYESRLANTAATYVANYVFVTGGRNDIAKNFTPGDEKKSIDTYMAGIRSKYPRARLFVVEAFWVNDEPPAELTQLQAWERQAATAEHATWIPTATWLYGQGMIAADGVHPSPKGHAAIRDHLIAFLKLHGVEVAAPPAH